MIRVALDVSSAGRPMGIGTYAEALAREVPAQAEPGDEVVWFSAHRPFKTPPLPPPYPPGVSRIHRPLPGRLLAPLWRAGLPPYADTLSGRPDVFHSLSFFSPAMHRAALIQTVHDLSDYRHPEWAESRPIPAPVFSGFLRRSRLLIAVSEHAARELQTLIPSPLPPVHVVPEGVDPRRFRPLPPDVVSRGLKRFGLVPGSYLLSIGTLQPRKNPLRLLEAWRALPRDGRPRLVWAGRPGWRHRDLAQALLSAAGEGVLWIRDAEADEMAVLLGGALGFCYPSLYEGFGLPVLEAMACGTPVLCGSASALPETAGGAALLADAGSAEALKTALDRLLGDAVLRKELITKGLARATAMTWAEAARRLWTVYREAAS